MALPENITLQVSLNGGAPQTGGITADLGDTVALSLQNPAGVAKSRYEIYEYPDGFECPDGWTEASNGVYFALTKNGAAAPSFDLPSDADLWGKFMLSVEVNDRRRGGAVANDLFDDRTAIRILSINGFDDVAFREGQQFDSKRQWAGSLKKALRLLNTNMLGQYVPVFDVTLPPYNATGDGVTDDTVGVAAAVAAAFASNGTVHWPDGTYVTTASIPNFHAVKHTGPGVVKRGSVEFRPEPGDTHTNALFVNPSTGDDSNDGLGASQAFETIQAAFDALQGNWARAMQEGFWHLHLAAGTYDTGAIWTKAVPTKNRFRVRGPSVAFGTPTAIIDGTDNSLEYGLNFNQGPSLVQVENIKCQNMTTGATGSGVVFDNGVNGYTVNVHAENCNWAGINANAVPRVYVEGGVIDSCRYGIRCYAQVHFTIGYHGDTTARVTITDCTEAGIQLRDSSSGHVDYTDIDGCPTGIHLFQQARAHLLDVEIDTCTTGVLCEVNSTWFDNASSPTVFTNCTTDKVFQGNSTDYETRQNFAYLDSGANRIWWGRGWYGTDVNTSAVYVWGTDRNTTAYWCGMGPSDIQIAGLVFGRPGANVAARFQYHHADATKNWRLVIENATAYRFLPTVFRPEGDGTQDLGFASGRWDEIFAANDTINTSDEREKEQIGPIPDDVLDAWAEVDFVRYKWRESVATKGDGARWHFGLIAQRVRDVFERHGLDAFAIGLLCHDAWEAEPEQWQDDHDEHGNVVGRHQIQASRPAGDRFGVRYSEALVLEAALMRRELQRLRSGQA